MKAYDVLQSLTVRDRTSTTKALKSAGLDANALMACADRTATKKVVSQLASTLSGVTLIPSFVFQDGEHMTGLPTYPELRGWVEAHISNR
jgi:predicted DsbA family dithiol-disulfide isomerase